MTSHKFPSSLHIQAPTLDTQVLRWAWSIGLFEEHAELERCRIQKINWFAGYLFPEESHEKLELIMRFFLCLFLLDDLLDHLEEKDAWSFLRGLRIRLTQSEFPRLKVLGAMLIQTHDLLGESGPSAVWRQEWMDVWNHYVSGLLWEMKNKSRNQMPSLEDYRYHRPSSSGVYMAIHLLRPSIHPTTCESELLEHAIARLICLSNDLASFDKEFAIGDFHNELIILRPSYGDQVQAWANMEIRSVQKRIHVLATSVSLQSETCKLWVESLFLMVGGCSAWSEETSRYVAYINGTLKSS